MPRQVATEVLDRVESDLDVRVARSVEVQIAYEGPVEIVLRLDGDLVCEQPPGMLVACEPDNSAALSRRIRFPDSATAFALPFPCQNHQPNSSGNGNSLFELREQWHKRSTSFSSTTSTAATPPRRCRFGLDGTTYEIDLNDKNAAALRDALAGYVGHARKVTNARGPQDADHDQRPERPRAPRLGPLQRVQGLRPRPRPRRGARGVRRRALKTRPCSLLGGRLTGATPGNA